MLLGLFILVVLGGISVLLLATIASGNPEAAVRIFTVLGGALGIALPVLGILYWNMKRKGG